MNTETIVMFIVGIILGVVLGGGIMFAIFMQKIDDFFQGN
jgi:ABC-type antimicrobial peptide transport system permease subunit